MLKMLQFYMEMISAKFLPCRIVLFGVKLQKGAKSSKFEIFEITLNMKSVSKPLIGVGLLVVFHIIMSLLYALYVLQCSPLCICISGMYFEQSTEFL